MPSCSQAQTQQQLQAQTGIQAGAQLGQLGQIQQQLQQKDVGQAAQLGGLQRQVAQQALQAQRQTEVARAYEPFQRLEFQKGIMTALPTAASQITQAAAPRANPLAQTVGTGLGAYAAFSGLPKSA